MTVTEIKRLKKYGFTLASAWLSVSVILFFLKDNSLIIKIFAPLGIIVLLQTIFLTKSLKHNEFILKKILDLFLSIITKVCTILLFVFVISPLSIIMKLFKQKTLSIKIDKTASTYWQDIEEVKIENRHKRQF